MENEKFKVLIISDRYNWGGASQVAKCIHDMLQERGYSSLYLYGYDKKGLPNKALPKNVISTNYLLGPHLNYLSYTLVGKNVFPSNGSKLNKLLKEADIVHLHNIHDYGFKYEQLLGLINKYDKPVVITCHDSWYLTGRCSIPRECLGWQTGCIQCSYKAYYHSSIFDFAAKERIRKLNTFKSLSKKKFVSPSKWLYEFICTVYGVENSVLISNSVDTGIFKLSLTPERNQSNRKPSLLIVANDFQDNQKVDINVVNFLIRNNVELHIVGSNSPFSGKSVTNHGTLDAVHVARVMNKCDIHLFMSKIDNQPLVVLESLCTGMLQFTFRTRAITGLSIDNDCIYLDDYSLEQLLEELNSPSFLKKKLSVEIRKARAEKYQRLFSREKMFAEYLSLYTKLLKSR